MNVNGSAVTLSIQQILVGAGVLVVIRIALQIAQFTMRLQGLDEPDRLEATNHFYREALKLSGMRK